MGISQFEPLLPSRSSALEEGVIALHRASAELASSIHPFVRSAVSELVRVTNAYHSNLIEGVHTTPGDIEAAVMGHISEDKDRARLQRLALAHIRVESSIAESLAVDANLSITSPAFLRSLHKQLYAGALPEDLIVRNYSGDKTSIIEPGAFRTENVVVGTHVPPDYTEVGAFLDRFAEVYEPSSAAGVMPLLAMAASHQRLAWVHPFLDGNGRVARLMTSAFAMRLGVDAGRMWSVSRGFARTRTKYYAALQAADSPRDNDWDGRGALSLRALEQWCSYVLEVSLDQIGYMKSVLEPDSLSERLRTFAAGRVEATRAAGSGRQWRRPSGEILARLVAVGELPRSEALGFFPGGERSSRASLAALVSDGILVASSHRAPLRLAFPPHIAAQLFPQILPSRPEAALDAGLGSVPASIPARQVRKR